MVSNKVDETNATSEVILLGMILRFKHQIETLKSGMRILAVSLDSLSLMLFQNGSFGIQSGLICISLSKQFLIFAIQPFFDRIFIKTFACLNSLSQLFVIDLQCVFLVEVIDHISFQVLSTVFSIVHVGFMNRASQQILSNFHVSPAVVGN